MRAHMVIGRRQEGSSVPQRIVAIAVGVLLSLGLLAGTAHAADLTVTPNLEGAGSIRDSADKLYSCTNSPQHNTDPHTCTAIAGHTCSGICPIILIKSVTLVPVAEAGWRFVGWKDGTAPAACTKANCTMTVTARDLVDE